MTTPITIDNLLNAGWSFYYSGMGACALYWQAFRSSAGYGTIDVVFPDSGEPFFVKITISHIHGARLPKIKTIEQLNTLIDLLSVDKKQEDAES